MMRMLLTAGLAVALTSVGDAGTWQNNYSQALEESTRSDKPILALFTDGVRPSNLEKLAQLDQYVLLHADRRQAVGQDLYERFAIPGADAVVVIERTHEWQYSRYERKLTDAEFVQLLDYAAHAKGKPAPTVTTATSSQWMLPHPSTIGTSPPSTISNYYQPSSAQPYCPTCRYRSGY